MSKLKNYDAIVEYFEDNDDVLIATCKDMADRGVSPFNSLFYSFTVQDWYDETYDAYDFACELLDSGLSSYELGDELCRNSCDEIVVYDEESVAEDIRYSYINDVISWLESKCPLDSFGYIPKELADLFIENTHRVSLFGSDGKLVCHITEMIAYDTAKSLAASLNELCNGSLCYDRKFVVTENGMEVFGEPSEVTINV